MCAKTSPKRGIFALLPFPLKALALVIFDQIAPQISNILSGKKGQGNQKNTGGTHADCQVITCCQGASETSASSATASAPQVQQSLRGNTRAWKGLAFANVLTLVLPTLSFKGLNEGQGNEKKSSSLEASQLSIIPTLPYYTTGPVELVGSFLLSLPALSAPTEPCD